MNPTISRARIASKWLVPDSLGNVDPHGARLDSGFPSSNVLTHGNVIDDCFPDVQKGFLFCSAF